MTVISHSMPCACRDRQIEEKRAAAVAAREAELQADRRMEAARIAASMVQEEREAARAVRAASSMQCLVQLSVVGR